ncbi:MAG TPA: CopG family transcriptional regulator [Candidatus Woesearchaeota archaeon]|nr:CopG family transcriptional regulator [Candidatus Woesearchaeota archaeon]
MVKIKKNILKKLEKRVKESGSFRNVDEYINYILEQVVKRLEREKVKEQKHVFSKKDEEKVKERLRSLGYLD